MRFYAACRHPAGACHPTARALLRWLEHEDPNGQSWGCYNRRKIAGSRSWSLHACGRAIDWQPSSDAEGWRLAHTMADYPDGAGVQLILWRDYQWGGRRGPGWRYTGRTDHDDHLHIEIRG